MGGRFGKYGDIKRRQVLQRSRRTKTRLTRENPGSRRKKKRSGKPRWR